jgi:hypothetical protein
VSGTASQEAGGQADVDAAVDGIDGTVHDGGVRGDASSHTTWHEPAGTQQDLDVTADAGAGAQADTGAGVRPIQRLHAAVATDASIDARSPATQVGGSTQLSAQLQYDAGESTGASIVAR